MQHKKIALFKVEFTLTSPDLEKISPQEKKITLHELQPLYKYHV